MILSMTTTGLICFICILVLAIYDLFALIYGEMKGQKAAYTVSQFLINTAFKAPMVSFGFGACAGHLWFVMHDLNCSMDWTERMIVAACGAAVGIGIEHLIKAAIRRWK